MLKHTLYGDGVHDDTDAIQELIDSGAVVDRIIIRNLTLENYTDGKCSKFHNCGEINNLYIEGLDGSEIDNDGVIKNLNIK